MSELVKWAREDNLYSKTELAQRSLLSVKTIYRIEHGANPTAITLAKLSKALDVPLDDLRFARTGVANIDDTVSLALSPINEELIKYLAKNPQKIRSLSPRNFEYLVADLLKDMGGEIEITPETRDGGRDIFAAFDTPIGRILAIVECKKLSQDHKVGLDIVERFLWTIDHKDRASCGLIATTSYFSLEAMRVQSMFQWKLKLKDFDNLCEWLSQYGKWSHREKYGLWLPATEKA